MRFTKPVYLIALAWLLGLTVLSGCSAQKAQKVPTARPTPPRVIKVIDKNPSPLPTRPAPPVCKASKGVKLQVVAGGDGWVLVGTGFQPGEEVTIDSTCAAPFDIHRSRYNGKTVDRNGQFRVHYPMGVSQLSQIDSVTGVICDTRVVHAKGVACIKVHITAQVTQLK